MFFQYRIFSFEKKNSGNHLTINLILHLSVQKILQTWFLKLQINLYFLNMEEETNLNQELNNKLVKTGIKFMYLDVFIKHDTINIIILDTFCLTITLPNKV